MGQTNTKLECSYCAGDHSENVDGGDDIYEGV